MKTIQAKLPENLYNEAAFLVGEGWFRDENEFFIEAVRRYLETHNHELMERFIREDVTWGLHGKD